MELFFLSILYISLTHPYPSQEGKLTHVANGMTLMPNY